MCWRLVFASTGHTVGFLAEREVLVKWRQHSGWDYPLSSSVCCHFEKTKNKKKLKYGRPGVRRDGHQKLRILKVLRCVTRVKICLCQMDAGDTLLSIPADTPMEQLSPIHIVRAWLFLFLIGKHQQFNFPVWNCTWSVISRLLWLQMNEVDAEDLPLKEQRFPYRRGRM